MKPVFDPAFAMATLQQYRTTPGLSLLDYQGHFKDHQVQRWLNKFANDPQTGHRPYLHSDDDPIAALEEVAASAPNFANVLRIFTLRAKASAISGAPFRAPPVLLLGPPGIGKTFVASQIAKALRAPFHELSFASDTSVNPLAGTDPVWRTPKIGLIARALLEDNTASPLFILDEIDKALKPNSEYEPLEPLHAALEPSQSAKFHDNYLEIDVAADNVIWIATANDLSTLPSSLRDRFQIVSVAPPDGRQMMTIADNLCTRVAALYDSWFDPEFPEDVALAVAGEHPRRAARVIDETCAIAAASGRHRVTVFDMRAALQSLCGKPHSNRATST